MKKLQLVIVAALLAVTATAAVAQDQPRGQGRGGGDPTPMLLQGITLSAEQQAKVDSLAKKMMGEMQAMRADTTVDMDTRRAKGREMRTKHSEALKALLTDDQKKVFEKNVADMAARQQGGGRPPQS